MMEDFDIKEIEPFLILIMGFFVLMVSIFTKNRSIGLKETGEKVEGTIFNLDRRLNRRLESEKFFSVMDKVTIRFVTKQGEWITTDINQSVVMFFTGQYKLGDKLNIYYDPTNPSNIYVDNKQSELLTRVLVAVAGVMMMVFGFYKLYL